MNFVLLDDVVNMERAGQPVGALTWDVENVLTDYFGNEASATDATVRPEVLEMMAEQAGRGILHGLITHNESVDFVDEVQAQVQEATDQVVPALSKADIAPGELDHLREKMRPNVFREMSGLLHVASANIGHVDDQAKSFIGAIRAGYGYGYWPRPWGEHEHPGVAKFRLVEMTIVRNLVRVLPVTTNIKAA